MHKFEVVMDAAALMKVLCPAWTSLSRWGANLLVRSLEKSLPNTWIRDMGH
jgi:hypothetical protein